MQQPDSAEPPRSAAGPPSRMTPPHRNSKPDGANGTADARRTLVMALTSACVNRGSATGTASVAQFGRREGWPLASAWAVPVTFRARATFGRVGPLV